MDFSIKPDMFKPGWSIVYIEGSQAIIKQEGPKVWIAHLSPGT